jgi:type II secretory pathway pseudopilin PulG
MIELVLVLTILGVVAGLAIPKLNLSAYRSNAAAQQIRSVFQTAQRTSLTRQHDVIISVDTIQGGLRIAEDKNNNGAIEVSEWKFWRPAGEGNRFAVAPKRCPPDSTLVPTSSVVGSQLKTVDGMPSVIFHRDGSTSSNAELYVSSSNKGRTEMRCVTLTRSTGRSEMYKLSGSSPNTAWILGNGT